MPERASIFQGVQVGLESTPGTAVLALKQLTALSIQPAIKPEVTMFRAMGNKFPALAALGKEWVEGKLDGLATYTELIYPLASVLNKVTPTGGSNAKTWTFSPANALPDTPATFTVEQGGYVRSHRFTYGLVNSLGLNFSRSECRISGSMLGKALEDNRPMSGNATYILTAAATPPSSGNFTLTVAAQTTSNIAYNATPAAVQTALEALSTVGTGNVRVSLITLGPTLAVANSQYRVEFVNAKGYQAITMTGTFSGLTPASSISSAAENTGQAISAISLLPVLPTQVNVYLADTAAGLGSANALLRPLSVSWEISDRFGAVWPLNSSFTSFAAVVETEPKLICKLKMEADDEGMALLTTMRAGSSKFMRIKALGDSIAGGGQHTLQIDTACKIDNVGEFSDEDGLFALEWSMTGIYDATWTKTTEVMVVNMLTAL